MDIKRLKGNQIRCALTEAEIEEMGFTIDEIIGNGETTQRFMKVVLEKVEEQEAIDVELLSPMVRAELLPDHSMAITFGGITEEEKKGMFGKILEMMNQMAGKSGQPGVPDFGAEVSENKENSMSEIAAADADEILTKSTPLALECVSIDDAVRVSRLFLGKEKVPQSSFYKTEDKYYLIMDFIGFSKQEMKPLAFASVEYNNRRIATEAGIAYIKEHGKCILAKDAICDLVQL
ncbi:MAG: adaptor protein MecA [Lachnospiraceae bacterium]|nr:adaptor protein MecA [Lachnospiraceae bacterium]